MTINADEILQTCRDKGFWLQKNIDFSREDFLDFCNSIGEPWPKEIHAIHTETVDDNNIIDWSSKTRFKLHSLPWHADNPWHPEYKFPIRAFYAVKIPDPKDGPLEFLNQTAWFENLPEERKEYFRSLQVLTQDYKGGISPFYSSFVKKNPIDGKESLYWGSKVVYTNTYGLAPDEGHRFNHFAFTMAIIKPSREIVSDEEISSWFEEMLEKYHDVVEFEEKDLLVMDNWSTLHYRRRLTNENERLLYRKTLLQPWQKFIG